ncbi:MAG: hypothetical protein JW969_05380 [Spirochaetales bacterium]|nr:hypothetical protein [Spirochaetales bacterium]
MMAESFIKKYPLSLREIIATPIIWRGNTLIKLGLPWPGVNHLKDLAFFAGFTYGAFRTALSRATATGDIAVFRDKSGKVRYKMSKLQQDISLSVVEHQNRKPGLSIAVFSFKTQEEKKRSALRQMLIWYGFKMLTQNVYITGAMDLERIENSAKEQGLNDHLYLFSCPDFSSTDMIKKISQIFEIKKLAKNINIFLKDMEGFIESAGDAIDFGRRCFYLGPVYHAFSFTNDVPLHQSLIPEDYPAPELSRVMYKYISGRMEDLVAYYLSLEK